MVTVELFHRRDGPSAPEIRAGVVEASVRAAEPHHPPARCSPSVQQRAQEGVLQRAVDDADHTLALMDLTKSHSDDESWTLSHEQYRPFVLFHRTQAKALADLENQGPEPAIDAINDGLERMYKVFVDYDAEEHFEEDELVEKLREMRESLRNHYEIGPTLNERLAQAIADERYEEAARLKDELAKRHATRKK